MTESTLNPSHKTLASQVWRTLSAIDVSDHVETKGNLSYLSWAWAWGVLMDHFPQTFYDFTDRTFSNGTMEVTVAVTIQVGEQTVTRTMWLPVMDYKNKAIVNPDAFAINTAKMRCLTKCLAMFGLGHYIYAGEDLPQAVQEAHNAPISRDQAQILHNLLHETESDVSKFCEAFKCSDVDSMLGMYYENALAALKRKKEKAA